MKLAYNEIADVVLNRTVDNSGCSSVKRAPGAGIRKGVIGKMHEFDWKIYICEEYLLETQGIISKIYILHMNNILENLLRNCQNNSNK